MYLLDCPNNLILVGQLFEKNYDVHFSCDGCLVQDQVLGKILAKGPEVGKPFPQQFSIPSSLSLVCMAQTFVPSKLCSSVLYVKFWFVRQ
jgi:hypothetical protein